jgi:hypothetical protein
MRFRVRGLDAGVYGALFGMEEEELRQRGAIRYVVDEKPGFPDRIELRDAEVGETVLLVNHVHQAADNPYRASHAIFVAERSTAAFDGVDVVPPAMENRLLSVRAFDAADMMIDADVVDGRAARGMFEKMLADERAAYLQVHTAKRGCYLGRVERA